MDDLVSIVTPTFNRGYIISNPIKSLLNQTYPNWEMIIIDDGSTDDTEKIIRGFKDKRIRYFKQKRKGQSAARNMALKRAKGNWIAYVDSDNELLPKHLETTLNVFKTNKKVLYIQPKANRTLELYRDGKLVKLIDDSGDFPKSIKVRDLFTRKFHFDLNGFIYSSKIIEAGIRFDENLSAFEDWDFAMLIAERFPDNFLYLPVTLYNYHQRYGGDGTVSNTPYREWAILFEKIYQKHKNDKLMKNQKWYPDRVKKWNKIADDFDKGLLPPPELYPFK